jgi:two-component system NarL family sensor kinase
MTDRTTWQIPPEAAAQQDRWVLLSDGRSPAAVQRPVRMRRVIVLTAIAAVAVAAVVALAGALVSRRIAENQAVHDVAEVTDIYAESVVQPVLTNDMLTDLAHARRVLDPIVHHRLLGDSLVRVKLWRGDGTVLYSDDARLIGRRFELEGDARAALTSPRTHADITDLQRPENRLDRNQGKLLEVYRPVWTPNGEPLLFETYFKYDTVSARSHELWRGFAGIMLSSIAALLLLLTPLVYALVNRTRRARAEREQVASWALEASNEERRRIAGTLHDGVVQQLAATSFAVAGEAQRATAAGDQHLGSRLQTLAGTVRDTIAGLRSLLVDIYPPSLRTSGLAAALTDLSRTTNGSGARVDVDVDDALADALPTAAREAAFRVAQEAFRNAVRHSGAHSVRLTLRREDGRAVLLIDDDGQGFDVSSVVAGNPQGHFGLHLIADAAARCGALLEVRSAPGRGTSVRMSFALT